MTTPMNKGIKPSQSELLRYSRAGDGDITEGWVVKEGQRLKQKKPRYLKLKGTTLSNHKTPESTASWSVSVVDSTVGPGTRTREIVVQLKEKLVSFYADTDEEYEKWICALKSATAKAITLETFYKLGDTIGVGINGEVIIGWDKVTNEPVAIKSIPTGKDVAPHDEEEIAIVKSLDHPNLVKTYDVFSDKTKEKVYIVMEYVPGGELWERVQNETQFRRKDQLQVAKDLLTAVQYLHEREPAIVHRDIKLENILCVQAQPEDGVRPPVRCKLGDFGLSARVHGDEKTLKSMVGTKYYLSPQLIKGEPYGKCADMWACGVVLYVMFTGKFPFEASNDEEYYANVVSTDVQFPLEDFQDVDNEAVDLIRRLMTRDPLKRLIAPEAANHAWIADVECNQRTLASRSMVQAIFGDNNDQDAGGKNNKDKKTPAMLIKKAKSKTGSQLKMKS